jgi:D-amino peptidase
MKIYIASDMEGISGIYAGWQLDEAGPWWPEARRLQVGDVNAAVQGALDGGANEVLVWDNHYRGHTLPIDEVHSDARVIMGQPHSPRFPCLDSSFAGVFLIGYHGMSGTQAAVLEHTMSSERFHRVFVNGQEMGEAGMDALWAGLRGVPVLLASGDDKLCAEVRRGLGQVETAEVKIGLARRSANMLAPARARELIRERAHQALALAGNVEPFRLAGPYEKLVEYNRAEFADEHVFDGQRTERIDGFTVAFRGDDLADVLNRW